MQKFMHWMEHSFAPVMNKLGNNPWIAALQQAILTAMPMVFIGSFITLIQAFGDLIPDFPDLSPISSFTFGLLSLFLAYLVPFLLMEKKHHNRTKKEAGLAGIALYLMIAGPVYDESGSFISFEISALGNGGMIAALISGLYTGFIMNLFAKKSFFKEDSPIPDFITVWFDAIIPILIVVGTGWIFTFVLNISLFDIIYSAFEPIAAISDSFFGFTFIFFLNYAFLYSFGISSWVLFPIESAIVVQGIAANEAAVAAGTLPTVINAYGTSYYWCTGGGGCTLALCIMMAFLAKSEKLRVVGRAAFVPSVCNINEPVVFGAPIAYNPILMIPMWIIGFAGPAITWIAMKIGLVPLITTLFTFWYLPQPIGAFAIGGVAGLLLMLFIFALSWIVYWPFFKVYDRQCAEEEAKDLEEKEARLAKKAAREAKRQAQAEVAQA